MMSGSGYDQFKKYGATSQLPFSPTKRNRVERSYNKFDRVNGYGASVTNQTYGWKVPKYDLK